MRKLGALAVAVVLGIGLAPGADAGVPPPPEQPDGTVNAASREHKWTSGPHTTLNPANFVDENEPCADGFEAATCDYEYVMIELPPAGASVEFSVEVPGATPVDDLDLYIYDATGRKVGESVNAAGTPGVPEKAKLRLTKSGVYIVEVAFWSVVNITYEGKVRLA